MKLQALNSLATSVSHHIETSQLICRANQSGALVINGLRSETLLKGIFLTLLKKTATQLLSCK